MLLRGPRRRSHQSRTSGNDFWNRYVFSRWRNRVNEGDDWISDGRVFHRVDAATGNDRRPMDSSRYIGMSSWCDVDERWWWCVACNSHQFRCASGACVTLSARCDGWRDCYDGRNQLQWVCDRTITRYCSPSLMRFMWCCPSVGLVWQSCPNYFRKKNENVPRQCNPMNFKGWTVKV